MVNSQTYKAYKNAVGLNLPCEYVKNNKMAWRIALSRYFNPIYMILRKHHLAKTTVQRFTQKYYNAKLIIIFIVWHFLYEKIALTFSFPWNYLIKVTMFEKRQFYHTKFHLTRFAIHNFDKFGISKRTSARIISIEFNSRCELCWTLVAQKIHIHSQTSTVQQLKFGEG